MSEATAFVLGIDGGGTRSRGCLATLNGEVQGEAVGGPLNHLTTSVACFRDSLRGLTQSLLELAPAGAAMAAAVVGTAGFFHSASAEDHRRLLHDILPVEATRLVGDAVTALHGATLGQAGILVIAGTGSIAAALDSNGAYRCHGGLGPLLESDPGSALWMAARAVRTAESYAAEHGSLDALGRRIASFLGVEHLADGILELYVRPDPARHLARLSSHLATLPGPLPAWREIEQAAGQALADLVAPLSTWLQRQNPIASLPPVHVSGSVLTCNRRVQDAMRQTLEARHARPVDVRQPARDAVAGAVELALRQVRDAPPTARSA